MADPARQRHRQSLGAADALQPRPRRPDRGALPHPFRADPEPRGRRPLSRLMPAAVGADGRADGAGACNRAARVRGLGAPSRPVPQAVPDALASSVSQLQRRHQRRIAEFRHRHGRRVSRPRLCGLARGMAGARSHCAQRPGRCVVLLPSDRAGGLHAHPGADARRAFERSARRDRPTRGRRGARLRRSARPDGSARGGRVDL